MPNNANTHRFFPVFFPLHSLYHFHARQTAAGLWRILCTQAEACSTNARPHTNHVPSIFHRFESIRERGDGTSMEDGGKEEEQQLVVFFLGGATTQNNCAYTSPIALAP